jgi:Tfp pilus assembly protein PilF
LNYYKACQSLGLALMLSACAQPYYSPPVQEAPGTTSSPIPVEESEAVPVVTPESLQRHVEPVQENPAVLALLDQANHEQMAGDFDAAVATVERALRIEPRNPRAYYQLALVRYRQDRTALASQLLLKGLSYPAGVRLQADMWRLLGDCRQAEGDPVGAREAREKASQLEAGSRHSG